MRIDSLCGRRVFVERGGRVFVVRPPTLATVLFASTRYEEEIRGYVQAALVDADLRTPVGMGQALAKILRERLDDRAGEVLETCCDVVGGRVGELRDLASRDAELAAWLAAHVIGLSSLAGGIDADAIEKLAGGGAAQDEPREEISQLELVICMVAERFGCAPHDVTQWPWEAFDLAAKSLPLLDPKQTVGASVEAATEVDLSQLAGLGIGIGVHKV